MVTVNATSIVKRQATLKAGIVETKGSFVVVQVKFDRSMFDNCTFSMFVSCYIYKEVFKIFS